MYHHCFNCVRVGLGTAVRRRIRPWEVSTTAPCSILWFNYATSTATATATAIATPVTAYPRSTIKVQGTHQSGPWRQIYPGFAIHSIQSKPFSTATKQSSNKKSTKTTPNLSGKAASEKNKARIRRLRRARTISFEKQSLHLLKGLPRRSPSDFGSFFDTVMKTYTLASMDEVLERILGPRNRKSTTGERLSLPVVLQTLLHTTNPTNQLQIQVLRFLLYNQRQAKEEDDTDKEQDDNERDRKDVDEQHHYPITTKNKPRTAFWDDGQQEEWVDLLMAARSRAVTRGLFWNKQALHQTMTKQQAADRIVKPFQQYASTTDEDLHQQALALAVHLRSNLPTKHLKALMDLLERYATDHASEYPDNDNNDKSGTTKPTTLQDIYEPERIRRPPMRLLSPDLYQALKTHFHLVANEVAAFFYLPPPLPTTFSATASSIAKDVTKGDEDLEASIQLWNASRNKFIKTLADLQNELLMLLNPHDGNDETLIEEEEEAAEGQDSVDEVAQAVDEMEQTLESAKSKTTTAEARVSHKRRGRHVQYNVIMSEEEIIAMMMEGQMQMQNLGNTIVFLDCLPIDVTENEIKDLYSRCGPVKSVKVFNQKPDLDPGPLSQSELQARRKKRLQSVKGQYKKWQRPRTPVYAVVEFTDEVGYKRAIDDTLRIFGMVIRRHPVRSIPAPEVKSLYLEKMTEGENCLELEYELERALDMQVSVAAGQSTNVLVDSCEITFSSFDVAWQAYQKLQNLKVMKKHVNAEIQWFRTPKDAEEWWNREKGFDL